MVIARSRIWPALMLIAVVLFLLLAWVKGTSAGESFDRAVLSALQNQGESVVPLGPAWLREAFRDLTALGSISVLALATLIGVAWLLLSGFWRISLLTAAVIAGGAAMSFLLKGYFSQPRPDLLSEPTQVFTSSFPSSHAMASLVTWMTLAWLLALGRCDRTARGYLLGTAVLITLVAGCSRLYLGVHWPSDVLAGWAAGLAWLSLCGWALQGRLAIWLAPELGYLQSGSQD